MTTKYLKLFIITTAFSYFLLIFLVSDIGIISYISLKNKISSQKIENEQLKNEIIAIEKYKNDLQEGKYTLDLAYNLGYIEENHQDFTPSNLQKFPITTSNKNSDYDKIDIPLFKNWKRRYFFYLSVIIGLVITIPFSVISIKINTKKGIKNE